MAKQYGFYGHIGQRGRFVDFIYGVSLAAAEPALGHDELLAVLPGLPLRPSVERDPRELLLRQTVNLSGLPEDATNYLTCL